MARFSATASANPRAGTPYNGLYGEAPPERGTFFQASGIGKGGQFHLLKYMKE